MNQNESALPIGSILQEYKVESILGVGGFGITYLANDTNLKKKVVIKEYLPSDIAMRKESTIVVPKSHDDENFKWGLERFLLEAQTLAKFNHPNIVKISRFFRANDTAYFVMDFEKGQDLEKYLKAKNNSLSEEEIYNIIMPILDGLREVHSVEYLHRDIKPANIFLRDNGSPMLIDFGASRFAMGVKSKSLSVVLTEGYAPKEQYSSSSIQGAYTDIYAIGAVMYKMATGKIPAESSARVDIISDGELDSYAKLQDQKSLPYGENFKIAVDWALALSAKDRPQSVREFQDALMGSVDTNTDTDTSRNIRKIEEPTLSDTKTEQETKQITKEEEGKSSTMPILIVLFIALLAGGGWYLKTTQDAKVTSLQQELEQRQRESQANANRAQQVVADDAREATRKAEENLQKQREEAKRIAVQKAQEDAKEAERIGQEAADEKRKRQEEADRVAQQAIVDAIETQEREKQQREADRIAQESRDRESASSSELYKVVNVASWDTLNVRQNPYATNNNIVGELKPYAKNIKIITCKNNYKGVKWCKVTNDSNQFVGWVVARCITPQSNRSPTYQKSGYRVVNIRSNDTLSVRNGPGTNYTKIGDLAYNATGVTLGACKYSSRGGRWCAVTLGNLRGWASAKYLRK